MLRSSAREGRSMAWFRRRREPGALAPPAVDPTMGDPAAVRLREAAVRGDWPAVRDFVAAVTDPEDHAFHVDILSRVEGAESWLGRNVAEEPDDALALLLAGTREVRWAWEGRTGARARDVTPERLEVFFERLKVAEHYLFEAVSRDPDSTSAWTALVTVAMGRLLGIPEARRRFDQVVIRS